MKVIMLRKSEKEVLTKLLSKLIKSSASTPYELINVLDKLDHGMYEYTFSSMPEKSIQSKNISSREICSYLLGGKANGFN